MSKDAEQIITHGKAVFYALFYNKFREAGLECGYAVAIHGSMERDMDVLAVPWIEDAKHPDELVKKLSDVLGPTIWKDHHFKNPSQRPHNRVSYTLSIYTDYFVDLSVIIPTQFRQ